MVLNMSRTHAREVVAPFAWRHRQTSLFSRPSSAGKRSGIRLLGAVFMNCSSSLGATSSPRATDRRLQLYTTAFEAQVAAMFDWCDVNLCDCLSIHATLNNYLSTLIITNYLTTGYGAHRRLSCPACSHLLRAVGQTDERSMHELT